MNYIIDILNTDAAVAGIAAIVVYFLGKLFSAKPDTQDFYEKYKGVIVNAVKTVEKNINDDTENEWLSKLDEACAIALPILEEVSGHEFDNEDITELEAKISEVHDELEDKGTL